MDVESGEVGTGMVGAPACGDVMRLQIKVGEDGVIQDPKFKTYPCGSAIASSSLLAEDAIKAAIQYDRSKHAGDKASAVAAG